MHFWKMAKNNASMDFKIYMGTHTPRIYSPMKFYANRPKNKGVMTNKISLAPLLAPLLLPHPIIFL